MAEDMSLDLEKVNSEVKKLIDQLKQVDTQIQKVTGHSSNFSNLFNMSGGQAGLGNSGRAQFSTQANFGAVPNGGGASFGGTSILGRVQNFMGNHPIFSGVTSAALGVAGGAYQAMPGLDRAMANASGYYDQTRASYNGMSRASMNAVTVGMQNSAGVTSALGLAPVVGLMASRNFVYGSSALTRSTYGNMIRETTNMGDYFGIDNMQAVQSMMQMRSGQTSGNLYRMGIMVRDPRTGRDLGLNNVAEQLYKRFGYDKNGMSADRIAASAQAGFLGVQLNRMGFDQTTQEVLIDKFKAKASGRDYNIDSVSSMQGASGMQAAQGNANPYNIGNRVNAAEANSTAAAEQYLLKGYQDAANIMVEANKKFADSVDKFASVLQAKGFMEGMQTSQTGQGISSGVGSFLGSLLGTRLGGGAVGKAVSRGAGALLQKGGQLLGRGALSTIGRTLGAEGLASIAADGGAMALGTIGAVGLGAGAAGNFVASQVDNLTGNHASGDKAINGWDWGKLAATAGTGAGIGAAAGLVGGPLAPITSGVGAIIGTVAGLGIGAWNMYHDAQGGGNPGYGSSVGGNSGPSGGQVAQPITGGHITTGFGQKGSRWKWKGYHTGVDYPCPVGTPVHAYKAGKVTAKQSGAAYGIHLILDHGDGTESLYGHLSKKLVSTGATVSAGQRIGLSGQTGNVTGPHLHFEIRRGNNNPVNPMPYLRGAAALDSGTTGNPSGAPYGENAGLNSTLIGSPASPISVSMTSGVSGNDFSLSGLLGSSSLVNRIGGGSGGTLGVGSSTTGISNSMSGGGGSTTAGSGVAPAAGGLIGILQKAGFRGDSLRMAYAIAMRESRGRAKAFNGNAATGDLSYGLFQINMRGKLGPDRRSRYGLHSNEELFDPATNAHVAYLMSAHGTNWSAWATKTNLGWKPFYNSYPEAARKAGIPGYSEGAYNIGRDHTANVHQGEMIVPAQLAQSMRQAMQSVMAGQGGAKTVNVTLKIERASEEEAVRFAKTVKKLWDNDSRIDSMRSS